MESVEPEDLSDEERIENAMRIWRICITLNKRNLRSDIEIKKEGNFMSVTKDSKTGKWMSQIRIKDWTGKEVHKKKRGFSTKKEALKWEKEFIEQSNDSIGMMFQDFINIYFKDMTHRLKPSTIANKRYLVETKIIPYFGKMTLNSIKPTDIRHWQNTLTSYRDENGKPYSETYLEPSAIRLQQFSITPLSIMG